MNQSHYYSFVPVQGAEDSGRVLLRDGSAADLRPARADDLPLLRTFFAESSAETRYRRFFSVAKPSDETLAKTCDNSDPTRQQTLLVLRLRNGGTSVVATASYFAKDEDTAEVAFAVADPFHGRGLGTLLLERLAFLAIRHGFTNLWAVTHADNLAMLGVFRDSGFSFREDRRLNEVEVELSLRPTEESVAKAALRDRLSTVASLRPFFEPRGVAVVGASRKADNIGHKILKAVIDAGFAGSIVPINPNAPDVLGRKCYPSIPEAPGPIDLAILAVPPKAALQAVDDAAKAGVRALLVVTAGFSEVRGAEGADLQNQLVDKVRGYGMRMIGPNCLGLLNTATRLNASFSPIYPPAGRVAMSSQSGALGLAVLAAANRLQLGLSTFVSVGNKADVSGNDLIQYWEEDPNTDVILLYLESFGNSRRFAAIAQRISQKKPIVAIKAGRGGAGARAASSHTAALASRDVAVDALFRQTGVLRVDTLEEMFDLAAALSRQGLPVSNRVAILTNAGGPGILCADACESAGLSLPILSDATQQALQTFLPNTASVTNPVDMVASARPEAYRQALDVLLQADEIDSVIVIYIPVGFDENAAYMRAIGEGLNNGTSKAKSPKTVLGCWMTEATDAADDGPPIPAYAFPEAPARVLGHMTEYANWRNRPNAYVPEFEDLRVEEARDLCEDVLKKHGPGWLTLPECFTVLGAFGLPVLPHRLATTPDEAVAAADQLGYPVVLKLSPRKLVHKSDIGGVRLKLGDAGAVRTAFQEMADAWNRHAPGTPLDGILVQPMCSPGIEVMSGVTVDPNFGPLIAFGLGGVLVEALQDVCFGVLPLTIADAREMVRAPKGSKVLRGFRGAAPVDLTALENVLLRLARLATELPGVKELDLNPILAYPEGKGCMLIDARIRIE